MIQSAHLLPPPGSYPTPPEKGQVHIGWAPDKSPVFVPSHPHWQVRAGTGRGKSTLIAYVLSQIIRSEPDSYLPVVDLGGDPFLRNFLRAECEAHGRPYREVALGNPASYSIDPIAASSSATVNEHASLIATGLGLLYGAGYGHSYFGRQNLVEIAAPLGRLEQAGIRPSLHALGDELAATKKRARKKDISEAELCLMHLRRVPELNVLGVRPELSIADAFESDKAPLDYFWLPAHRDEMTAVSIATLVVAAVISEAVYRFERKKKRRWVHLTVDEAAMLNGCRTFESTLPFVRKWMSVKILHQFTEQWYTHGRYMPSAIAANCAVRILFGGTSDEDFDELLRKSREEPKSIGQTRAGNTPESLRFSERIELRPRLERNTINDVTDTPGTAFLTGLAIPGDPQVFRIQYPTSRERHAELSDAPVFEGLCEEEIETEENGRNSDAAYEHEADECETKLGELLSELRAREAWHLVGS